MAIFKEEILEPIARLVRFYKGFGEITKKHNLVALDLGCGPENRFFQFCRKRGVTFAKYRGIDPLYTLKKSTGIVVKKTSLNKTIPEEANSVDYIFGFAFIEHIDHPEEILLDSYRVLKKGGKAIFTTPTPFAKQFLETLSFKLGIISRREIAEHKNYFDKTVLLKMVSSLDRNAHIKHEYFELGLNNLLTLEKTV